MLILPDLEELLIATENNTRSRRTFDSHWKQ